MAHINSNHTWISCGCFTQRWLWNLKPFAWTSMPPDYLYSFTNNKLTTQGCTDLLTNSCSVWFQVTVAPVNSSAFFSLSWWIFESSVSSINVCTVRLCRVQNGRRAMFWMMLSGNTHQIVKSQSVKSHHFKKKHVSLVIYVKSKFHYQSTKQPRIWKWNRNDCCWRQVIHRNYNSAYDTKILISAQVKKIKYCLISEYQSLYNMGLKQLD